MEVKEYPKDIKEQVLEDLTQRSKRGVIFLLVVWLLIVFSFHIHEKQPNFFYINLSIFSFFIVIRVLHLYIIHQGSVSTDKMLNYFVAIIIATGLHWGIMVAWITYYERYHILLYFLLTITSSVSIGGALTFSICNKLRIAYPLAMNLPVITIFLYTDNTKDTLIVMLLLLSIIYTYLISSNLNNDYWHAINANIASKQHASEMEKLSITDPLTQINNRLFFNKQLNNEWKRSVRSNEPLSILILDLDYFKRVNDTFGHVVGDELLKKVAKVLSKAIIRETDSLARFGGEEFVFLLPNTDSENAEKIAQRLLRATANIRLQYEDEIVKTTCSIGGATIIPCVDKNADYLLEKADKALYEAKNNGRNQYNSFDYNNANMRYYAVSNS